MRGIGRVKRVVVKVGSAVISGKGKLRPKIIAQLAAQVAHVRRAGQEIILVCSGAIVAGHRVMGLPKIPVGVVERQSSASVGQYLLMAAMGRAFARHKIHLAQLLLSAEDIENRRRFISARHTMHMLLSRGILPVVNENDALSTDQNKVGDNDHLAALVTNLVTADLLVLLSVAKGLCADGGAGAVIPRVEIGSSVDAHVGRATSEGGTGGMIAKVSAARLASHWGVPTVLAFGQEAEVLTRILGGEEIGTLFVPRSGKLSARKQWIAMRSRSHGVIRVDAGARQAVTARGASLLPSGVKAVEGTFPMGARVDLRDESGETFAVGLVSYSSHEIDRIKGRKQSEVRQVLGYEYTREIINRDDMVIL